MAMKATEVKAMVKDTAIEAIIGGIDASNGVQIDDYTYVIPVEVEGAVNYAKITVTACQMTDTKSKETGEIKTKGFDVDTAVEAYATKCAEREAKVAAKANA